MVSVIVPVFNDAARLASCLDALARQSWPTDRREVIVVDNGSAPPLALPPGMARLVVETRPGSYAARNAGVAAATGDILAFTDADCVPAADWIERGVGRLIATAGCGLVAGAIQLTTGDPPTVGERYELATAFPQRRFVEEQNFGATANVFTSRVVFERVGGFDAELLSAGDVDFGERVHAAGYQLVYAADARIDHPARTSIAQLCRKIVRTEAGLRDLEARRAHRIPGYRPRRRPVIPSLATIRRVASERAELERKGAGGGVAAAAAMAFLAVFQSAVAVAVNAGLRPQLRRIRG